MRVEPGEKLVWTAARDHVLWAVAVIGESMRCVAGAKLLVQQQLNTYPPANRNTELVAVWDSSLQSQHALRQILTFYPLRDLNADRVAGRVMIGGPLRLNSLQFNGTLDATWRGALTSRRASVLPAGHNAEQYVEAAHLLAGRLAEVLA